MGICGIWRGPEHRQGHDSTAQRSIASSHQYASSDCSAWRWSGCWPAGLAQHHHSRRSRAAHDSRASSHCSAGGDAAGWRRLLRAARIPPCAHRLRAPPHGRLPPFQRHRLAVVGQQWNVGDHSSGGHRQRPRRLAGEGRVPGRRGQPWLLHHALCEDGLPGGCHRAHDKEQEGHQRLPLPPAGTQELCHRGARGPGGAGGGPGQEVRGQEHAHRHQQGERRSRLRRRRPRCCLQSSGLGLRGGAGEDAGWRPC
mmetsp:Transcript_82372/g.256022  ORF Transcript_82372/g.256022 Transcript_82372/m.256022 type:complete len:254 (-) Transcript_82372:221-982(-)